jgi:hypothetical protein
MTKYNETFFLEEAQKWVSEWRGGGGLGNLEPNASNNLAKLLSEISFRIFKDNLYLKERVWYDAVSQVLRDFGDEYPGRLAPLWKLVEEYENNSNK